VPNKGYVQGVDKVDRMVIKVLKSSSNHQSQNELLFIKVYVRYVQRVLEAALTLVPAYKVSLLERGVSETRIFLIETTMSSTRGFLSLAEQKQITSANLNSTLMFLFLLGLF